jgi:monofunctional biosynthetic peptidoglycan transglycosylase
MARNKKRRRLRWYHWLVLPIAGFYTLVLLSLIYLRYLPPLTTGVQMQRRVEAMLSGAEYEKRYHYLPLSGISDNLEHAVVAAEDTRFYQHHGFDWVEIRKAQEDARRRGTAPRGASTITQQLVKNLYFTTHRSVVRKGLEATITPLAERVLGKDRILELYLNVIEWGPGVYGAEAATEYHYGVPAGELSRDRAARLAAIIPAPRERTPERMDGYARTVQARMREMGW